MKLKVSSKPERFRRAGFAFTREPQEIEVDEKIADALKGEPMLVVEEVKEPLPCRDVACNVSTQEGGSEAGEFVEEKIPGSTAKKGKK